VTLEGPGHHPLHRLGVARVKGNGLGPAAARRQPVGLRASAFLVAVGEDGVRPPLGETPCQRRPDARCPAGDDGHGLVVRPESGSIATR